MASFSSSCSPSPRGGPLRRSFSSLRMASSLLHLLLSCFGASLFSDGVHSFSCLALPWANTSSCHCAYITCCDHKENCTASWKTFSRWTLSNNGASWMALTLRFKVGRSERSAFMSSKFGSSTSCCCTWTARIRSHGMSSVPGVRRKSRRLLSTVMTSKEKNNNNNELTNREGLQKEKRR